MSTTGKHKRLDKLTDSVTVSSVVFFNIKTMKKMKYRSTIYFGLALAIGLFVISIIYASRTLAHNPVSKFSLMENHSLSVAVIIICLAGFTVKKPTDITSYQRSN